jgi:hypothetical protein
MLHIYVQYRITVNDMIEFSTLKTNKYKVATHSSTELVGGSESKPKGIKIPI